jgi:type VI protein secretion system component Hcp
MRDNRVLSGALALAIAALMLPDGGAFAAVNNTTTRSNTQHNVQFDPALGHGAGKRKHGRLISKTLDSTSGTLMRASSAGNTTHHHKVKVIREVDQSSPSLYNALDAQTGAH